ncbi:hypothetical protein ABZ883_22675 [Streptomyces sp. NPDC046977]|uniref:hypothetical protein n=1 Tax=Streptomyces sp. NPDC046977 TaxID=3154703 RepID=UPI00340B8CF6
MASTLVCTMLLSRGAEAVYAWEDGDGAVGYVLIDAEEEIARPCTRQGRALGDTVLRKHVGNVEEPDPDPVKRRSFLVAASVIFQEWQRQGRLPQRISRTYW